MFLEFLSLIWSRTWWWKETHIFKVQMARNQIWLDIDPYPVMCYVWYWTMVVYITGYLHLQWGQISLIWIQPLCGRRKIDESGQISALQLTTEVLVLSGRAAFWMFCIWSRHKMRKLHLILRKHDMITIEFQYMYKLFAEWSKFGAKHFVLNVKIV